MLGRAYWRLPSDWDDDDDDGDDDRDGEWCWGGPRRDDEGMMPPCPTAAPSQ